MPNLTPVMVDASVIRERLHAKTINTLQGLFPIDLKGRTLELHDAKVHVKDFSPEEQKHALMTEGTLNEAVRGTLVLRGVDGKVIDEAKNFTLLHLPYFTERHTVVSGGNEYQIANMLRRKPGVYTQRGENGELHTTFNLSKGRNFDLGMNEKKGTFYIQYGTSNIPLYPVLRALGVPHEEISNRLGASIAGVNKMEHGHQQEMAINKMYTKLVHESVQDAKAPLATKLQAVKDKLGLTAMDPEVTHVTLGERHDKVTTHALLNATRKLLKVHEGKEEVDDSDSLAFKTFHSMDDFISERIKLTARAWAPKVKMLMNGKSSIREALKPAPFSDHVKKFITTSALTAVPTGINPIELFDHAVKVTSLGEGGIPSDRAIPYEARMTHPTHLGILDPIRTPESGHAGVDIRASISAHRDDAGNLYTPMLNPKTGEQSFMQASEVHHKVIAFPHQVMKGMIDAIVRGKVKKIDASQVDYVMPHSLRRNSPRRSTLIPLLHNIQGNRAIMGSKMQTQGLPLVEREVPLVQVKSHMGDFSFETVYGHMVVPTTPVSGRIVKIDKETGYIHIRPDTAKKADWNEGGGDYDSPDAVLFPLEEIEEFEKEAADSIVKVPFQTYFPFPSKTALHHTLEVKVGDHVNAGERLGDSNFTREGTLALGKNLSVAYMAYHGLNSNDAVVISEGCAKKLTSEHMYRETFALSQGIEVSKDKHKMYFGPKYAASQYAGLDDTGVIKKGARIHPKDFLVAGLVKNQIQGTDAMLGRISKSLAKPYREATLTWEHGTPGEVIDVVRSSGQIAILVKTLEVMQVGDKLAGRYGNKGVVSKIVPDHEMIQGINGKPIDLLLTSAGVISRINPAQIIETAIAKVAEKTGKPIIYDNAEHKDATQWAKALLKKHGISDKERVYDPVNKKFIDGPDGKGVMVGKQYIFKLFKSTDTNFAGHGVGPYDINEQPLKSGGDEGAKGLGKMEFDALLAHNARNILHETATIKGTKNDEFWRAIQLGQAMPTPKSPFAWNKFTAMLEGAGIKVDKRGSKLKLLPLTDKDVLARSTGAIENSKTLIAKNLHPEAGGLFDPRLTGGAQGTLYSHINLHEPIVNPVFEEPVRRLLGWTQKQFESTLAEKGGEHIKQMLAGINVGRKITELRARIDKAHGAELNDLIKQVKYLEALQREGMRPHEAYVISKVPVIPPVFRPILPQPTDQSQLMIADANKLYAHLMDSNYVHKNTVLQSDIGKHRLAVYNALGAVYGTHEVANDELKGQSVKGFLTQIAGAGSPKGGFFQRKLMKRTQDVSGRGTAVPDGNLGMDDVGIPLDMLWQMFDKLLVARLVRTGYPALEARRQVDSKSPAAKDALMLEIKERPVMINRAPTLHRFSIIAAYAKPTQGKTIRVNAFSEKGLNLDYDGDTLQVHAPITTGAIEDTKRMTLSQMLLSDQTRNKLMIFPQHEAVLGVTLASKASMDSKATVKHFPNREAVLAAWRRGEINMNDSIEVATEKKASDDEDEAPCQDHEVSVDEDILSLYPPEHVTGECTDA